MEGLKTTGYKNSGYFCLNHLKDWKKGNSGVCKLEEQTPSWRIHFFSTELPDSKSEEGVFEILSDLRFSMHKKETGGYETSLAVLSRGLSQPMSTIEGMGGS